MCRSGWTFKGEYDELDSDIRDHLDDFFGGFNSLLLEVISRNGIETSANGKNYPAWMGVGK